jgi:hypothetical protein
VELTGFDPVEFGLRRRSKTTSVPRLSIQAGLAGKTWTIDAGVASQSS